jgi:hypothetical protein
MNVTWNGKGSRTVTQFEAAAFRGDSRGGFCGNPSLCLQFTRVLFPFEGLKFLFSLLVVLLRVAYDVFPVKTGTFTGTMTPFSVKIWHYLRCAHSKVISL